MTFKQSGFTLIELLIALLILSITAGMMVTGLQSAIRTQNKVNQKAARLAEVQSAILIMERDIAQIINRPILTEKNQKLPALYITYPEKNLTIEFTRSGFINPLAIENRTTLLRVSYYLTGTTLIRSTWPVLDRPTDTTSEPKTILTGVNSFTIQFAGDKNQFITPAETPIDSTASLPRAIEFNLKLDGLGDITRIIPITG